MRARAWLSIGVAALSSAALGVLLGLLWVRLAPRVELFVSAGKGYPQGFQPEGYMTADGVAALLCTAAGLVACYAAALPFYRWMPVGDVAWTAVVLAGVSAAIAALRASRATAAA